MECKIENSLLDQYLEKREDFKEQIESIQKRQKVYMIILGFLNNTLYYVTFNLLSILFEDFPDPSQKQQRNIISQFCLLFNFLANILYQLFFINTSYNIKLMVTIFSNIVGGIALLIGIYYQSVGYYMVAGTFVGIGQTVGVICLNVFYKLIPQEITISMNHGFTISSLSVTLFLRYFMITKEQPNNLFTKESIIIGLIISNIIYYLINQFLLKSIQQVNQFIEKRNQYINEFSLKISDIKLVNQNDKINDDKKQPEKSDQAIQKLKKLIQALLGIKYYTFSIMLIYMFAYSLIFYITKQYISDVIKSKNEETLQQNMLAFYYLGLMLARVSIDYIKIKFFYFFLILAIITHYFYVYSYVYKYVIEVNIQYFIIFCFSLFTGWVQINSQYYLMEDTKLIKNEKEFYSLVLLLANHMGSYFSQVLIFIYKATFLGKNNQFINYNFICQKIYQLKSSYNMYSNNTLGSIQQKLVPNNSQENLITNAQKQKEIKSFYLNYMLLQQFYLFIFSIITILLTYSFNEVRSLYLSLFMFKMGFIGIIVYFFLRMILGILVSFLRKIALPILCLDYLLMSLFFINFYFAITYYSFENGYPFQFYVILIPNILFVSNLSQIGMSFLFAFDKYRDFLIALLIQNTINCILMFSTNKIILSQTIRAFPLIMIEIIIFLVTFFISISLYLEIQLFIKDKQELNPIAKIVEFNGEILYRFWYDLVIILKNQKQQKIQIRQSQITK